MLLSSTLLILGLAPLALAAPQYGADSSSHSYNHDIQAPSSDSINSLGAHAYSTSNAWHWAAGKVTEYPILFCNASETTMIKRGLREAEILAAHARDHIHRWGNSSSFYTKYFGRAATAEPAGWFDKIVNSDKSGVVFRCDDPDGKCAGNETWAGHWRGENGTDETVICPPSYSERWHLDEMCMHGWTLAGSSYSQYWASDLHHRLFHTVKIGMGVVDHYADDYAPALELAMDSPEEAVRNAHSLLLFALEVYAYDIASPMQGCTGEYVPEEEDEEALAQATCTSSSSSSPSSMAMTTSSSVLAAEATAEAASTTEDEAETATTSSEEHCRTHSDTGEVHCT